MLLLSVSRFVYKVKSGQFKMKFIVGLLYVDPEVKLFFSVLANTTSTQINTSRYGSFTFFYICALMTY